MDELEKMLATFLHEKHCHYNHADYCPWFYEFEAEDPWSEYAHRDWLRNAKDVLFLIEKFKTEKNVKKI